MDLVKRPIIKCFCCCGSGHDTDTVTNKDEAIDVNTEDIHLCNKDEKEGNENKREKVETKLN